MLSSMESRIIESIDGVLASILRWNVNWLSEQKKNLKPPPICRVPETKLKITYQDHQEYENTFIPLLLQEIWAQLYEEWQAISRNPSLEQLEVGVVNYGVENKFQSFIHCQQVIKPNDLNQHLNLIRDGYLVRLVLPLTTVKQTLDVFAYVSNINAERITKDTTLAQCFTYRPASGYHIINYRLKIAKRDLPLNLATAVQMTGLYYVKPMLRQVGSVYNLRESCLAKEILHPTKMTCQLSVPAFDNLKSPNYNETQYKAILGTNDALSKTNPKIQLIQGPPGTGKTHTLLGIIKHFYMSWKDTSNTPKLLICAPSNGAIDEVAKRLYQERHFLKEGPAKRSLELIRIGILDKINESVKPISLDELVESSESSKAAEIKKNCAAIIPEIENQIKKYRAKKTHLKFSGKYSEISATEMKIAHLMEELEATKASMEVESKHETTETSKKNMKFKLVKNADVILTTLNSCRRYPLDIMFNNNARLRMSFHCLIVDEASQCCEPELLMPLCYRILRMILIGDPMQLPATVISRYAQQFNFGQSLFERFFIHFGRYDPLSPIAMLKEQYRMHPDICHFPSRQFYDNRLISARFNSTSDALKPYVMFDLEHSSEKRSTKIASLENMVEADFVRNLLVAVLGKASENSTIGVITPYKGQKNLIINRISDVVAERNIKIDVNTCDGFQGQEKDIIILSCVRASEFDDSIGFLKSYQRINVALTRAKHCLIVCISTKSLTKDKIWEALVNDARERYMLQTLTQTPSSDVLLGMISNSLDPTINSVQT